MQSENIKYNEILSFNETRSVEAVEFYALDLKPQDSNKILKQYVSKLPQLKDYLFLKRFKRVDTQPDSDTSKDNNIKLTILLSPVSEVSLEELESIYKASETELELEFSPYIVNVPKYQPLTRDQFNQCKDIWPVNFKEIKIGKEPLTTTEKANLSIIINKLVNNNNRGDVSKSINSVIITDLTKKSEDNDSILIECLHSKPKTPVDHVIMKSIEIVAQKERSKRAIHIDNMLKRKAIDNDDIITDNDESFEKGYLCKDLDVITLQEPCAMCSMALVHSRIRKLFYINTHKSGCIESNYRMHQLNDLNHKFRSYRIDLQILDIE